VLEERRVVEVDLVGRQALVLEVDLVE